MEIPEPPPCPPKLREYLELIRKAVMTNRPLDGKGTHMSEHPSQGTVVDADDCPPCS